MADALSCVVISAISSTELGIDFSVLAPVQCDGEMAGYRTAITGLQLEDVKYGPTQYFLLCDTSWGQPRPVVAISWRPKFVRISMNSHTLQYMQLATSWQPGLFGMGCLSESRVGQGLCCLVQRHVRAPMESFKFPHRCFDHIHEDMVVPLPPSQDFTYLFTFVDHFTQWPKAVHSFG